VKILERVCPEVERIESYRLRCLAPLAEATGDADIIGQADATLARLTAPDGSAWVLGADVYLCLARAWYRVGHPHRAEQVLAPLLAAARRIPWRPVVAEVERLQAVHASRSSAPTFLQRNCNAPAEDRADRSIPRGGRHGT
jgi:hypothetical protein